MYNVHLVARCSDKKELDYYLSKVKVNTSCLFNQVAIDYYNHVSANIFSINISLLQMISTLFRALHKYCIQKYKTYDKTSYNFCIKIFVV